MFIQAEITTVVINQSGKSINHNNIGHKTFLGWKSDPVPQKLKRYGANIELHEKISVDNMIKKYLNSKLIVSIEEHNIIGGLGSAICEETAKLGKGPKHIFFGINDEYLHHGDYKYLLQSYGLTPDKIVNKIKKNL